MQLHAYVPTEHLQLRPVLDKACICQMQMLAAVLMVAYTNVLHLLIACQYNDLHNIMFLACEFL